MEKQQIWGIAGCALLLLGGLTPLVSMGMGSVCFYDLPFFYKGTFLALILASGYLIWRKDYKPLTLTAAGISLLWMLKFMDAMNMPPMVSMSYGWLVLLAGILVLSRASGFKWRDGFGALIPQDLQGRLGVRPAPAPPPGGMPPFPTAAPPPPVGVAPPPPRPGPVAPPVSGAPVCAHCQAPVSAAAKFCRACGSPVTMQPAAPPPPAAAAPLGRVCGQCRAPLSAAAKFCRQCGAPVPPTACPQCSLPLEPGERFCSGCGQAIHPV
jgi:ribosomal protein L40E